jgi:hypothetical protein
MTSMTEKAQRILRRIRDDARWYVQRFLWIITKDNRTVSLDFSKYPSQAYYFENYWKPDWEAGNPIRHVVLKARQQGISTCIDSLLFQDTATHKNVRSQIISHDEDSTSHLFSMVKLFYDMLPDGLKPMQRYSNKRELVFENPDQATRSDRPGLRSRLSVAYAKNIRAGRSKTLKHVHGSEAPLYGDLVSLRTGIEQSVPFLPRTSIVWEGTANGFGTPFHRLYEAAKRGENGYKAIFIPWYIHPEYSLTFASDEARKTFLDTLTDDPESGSPLTARKSYKLTDEQLHWRQEKIKTFDTVELFWQEYPENDIECFLTSGQHVFPVRRLRELLALCKPPKWRGELTEREDGAILFRDDPQGRLRLWELPQPEHIYGIGGDVAEGLAGGDFSAGVVLDLTTYSVVGLWHGRIDPDLFSDELYRLGWYFNEAVIGVEINKYDTAITTLKKRYGNVFYRTVLSPTDPSVEVQKLGWLTDTKSKQRMENDLRAALRDESLFLPSQEAVEELLSYVVHDDGSTGANVSCYDDIAIALMIALQVAKLHRIVDPEQHKRRKLKRRQLLGQFSSHA